MNDLPTLAADLYAPGGQGGIRGFMTAEINLPDATYAGDLVVGCAHLKAGSTASDHTQRVTAAANIAYFLDYFWNGAGTGTPDPRRKFSANPAPTAILGPNTPIITGGDWNEDEQQNGATIGPADWITRAQVFDTQNGTDGTDRNRTDMTYDAATDVFTGNRNSLGTFKPDHMAWQDSLCAARRAFLFNTSTLPGAAVPAELSGYPTVASASATASDHLPLTVDFILPLALPCNSAGHDQGFAKVGGNGRFPRFSACGSLAGGQSAVLTLGSAAPLQPALLVISPAQGMLNVLGGTVVPVPPILAGPLTTDASGGLALTVPGGGATISMWAQWLIVDPAVSFGTSFSNALRLDFRP